MSDSDSSDYERRYYDTEPDMHDSSDYAWRRKAAGQAIRFRTSTECTDSSGSELLSDNEREYMRQCKREDAEERRFQQTQRREMQELVRLNLPYPNITMKPAIFIGVPTLKEIATVKIVVALWNHVNIPRGLLKVREKYARNGLEWREVRQKVMGLSSQLSIENTMIEHVDNYVIKIRNEMDDWIGYHFPKIFSHYSKDKFIYHLIYSLVWYQNGTIDCKQTARNLLNSDKLTAIEKYRMLCTYCMKKEMKRLKPLPIINGYADFVDPASSPLNFYWDCYFKDKMHKIPVGEEVCINQYMFQHHFVDNWTAKEYFFNRLYPDEQVKGAISLIDTDGVKYQKVVLMKLNETQRLVVYKEKGAEIIANYAKTKGHFEECLSTWNEVRNFITPDGFVSMFKRLMNAPSFSILPKIWSNSPMNFKHHLMYFNDHEIIKELMKSQWRYCAESFLCSMVRDMDTKLKHEVTQQEFFKKYCNDQLSYFSCKADSLDEFLNTCFPHAEELAQYKRDLYLNSEFVRNRCFRFYWAKEANSLDDVLAEYFSSYPDAPSIISEYKKNLLLSSDGIEKCVQILDSKQDKLNEIIDMSLPDAESRAKFLKTLIFSPQAISKFQQMCKGNRKDEVKECLDRYLVSNEDKIQVKKQVHTQPRKMIGNVFFKTEIAVWQKFLMWYYDDEKLIKIFKRSLHVDEIFNQILRVCVFETKSGIVFEPLDRFLFWYFETPIKTKQYKIQKANAYQSVDVIATLLKKNDVKCLKLVFHWFFDNDTKEIVKFKSKNKGRISDLI